jgi:outer membrane protein TolC
VKPLRLGTPCLLVLLLTAPIAASSGQAAPPLRWPQVVAALAQQPLVREAEARAAGAAGGIRSAQEFPNPIVTITGADAVARAGPGHRREWGFSVEQPLDFLATRGARVAAARATAEGVEQEALAVRARVLRTLRRDFVALAHAQARL